ncbi:PIR Superfamily Protein [Plasmodium ovale curtisi]|uniref:PIR Superfamily Protein n=1 Tax=Plasmodium ovale curtisi TaxID=864141 RepID=A0A1A8XCY5_PLAOA|nr:PIR Superfamily Protein [Plasmodium ovale curtisi]
MPPEQNSYTHEMFVGEDDTLTGTLLHKFYNEFEDASCKAGDTEEYCKVNNYKLENERSKELYEKLVINLKNISNKKLKIDYQDVPDNKLCIYLRYWFYDWLVSENFNDSTINKLINILEEQKDNIYSGFNCEFYKMKLEVVKFIKALYNYFLFYDRTKVQKKKIKDDPIFKSEYCNYIKNSNFVYTTIEASCARSSKISYCNDFNKYIKNFIDFDDELESITCNDDKNRLSYNEMTSLTSSELGTQQMHLNVQSETGGILTIATFQQETNPVHPPKYALPHSAEPGVIDDSTENPNGQQNIIPTVVSLSLFTPFRSLLYPTTQRFKHIGNIINKKIKHILLRKHESHRTQEDDKLYNIAYNSR